MLQRNLEEEKLKVKAVVKVKAVEITEEEKKRMAEEKRDDCFMHGMLQIGVCF